MRGCTAKRDRDQKNEERNQVRIGRQGTWAICTNTNGYDIFVLMRLERNKDSESSAASCKDYHCPYTVHMALRKSCNVKKYRNKLKFLDIRHLLQS